MVIFHSYVSLPEGNNPIPITAFPLQAPASHLRRQLRIARVHLAVHRGPRLRRHALVELFQGLAEGNNWRGWRWCDYIVCVYIVCIYICIYVYINIYIYCLYIHICIVRERITIYLSKMFDMFLKDDSMQQRTEDPTLASRDDLFGPEFSWDGTFQLSCLYRWIW